MNRYLLFFCLIATGYAADLTISGPNQVNQFVETGTFRGSASNIIIDSGTYSGNANFTGSNVTMGSQVASSGSSAMTRDLVDSRLAAPDYFLIREDFNVPGSTSGMIGVNRWSLSNATTGTATYAGQSSAWPNPGVGRLTTTATASGNGGAIILSPANSTSWTGWNGASWVTEWVVRPQTVTNISLRFGFMQTPQSANDDATSSSRGVYIRFDTGTGDTNFMAVIGGQNTGAEVRRSVSLGVAPAANTWVRIKMRRIASNQFGFSVNGGAETTLTATVGDAFYEHSVIGFGVWTLTTGAASADIDFFSTVAASAR